MRINVLRICRYTCGMLWPATKSVSWTLSTPAQSNVSSSTPNSWCWPLPAPTSPSGSPQRRRTTANKHVRRLTRDSGSAVPGEFPALNAPKHLEQQPIWLVTWWACSVAKCVRGVWGEKRPAGTAAQVTRPNRPRILPKFRQFYFTCFKFGLSSKGPLVFLRFTRWLPARSDPFLKTFQTFPIYVHLWIRHLLTRLILSTIQLCIYVGIFY